MNILITGVTGLLGKSLVEMNVFSHNITGIYLGKYKMANTKNLKYYCSDIQDKNAMQKIFNENNNIEVVIHTTGIADVDFCQQHYEEAYRSNVIGTQNIIELCKETGARLLYVSTNAVFDGENAPYREEDEPNPINNYGRIKLECEKRIRETFNKYIIVRPILMYGWNNPNERKNLVTFLLDKLNKKERVNMVNDVYENPLSAYHCADVILSLIDKDKHGIYHIAGKDIVNRYEYAIIIADIFGLDKDLIRPVDSSFFPHIAPRPKNTSYLTLKLEKELGFIPLGLRDGLIRMKGLRRDGN
ncbi:MAG: NAD(P)-dependent oxidoreductase [Candidatus Omnitrophica bacterium]|nr:NAD(P)-dependent oxidoreductase [Candidatus Omnitrophota bacterium]MDD5591857.1 NAD(P)-dependent oxidoreductase [Candidatus Omnitrophota bacterium]